MGLEYLPYIWPKFLGFHVGKYACLMDFMGKGILRQKTRNNCSFRLLKLQGFRMMRVLHGREK